MKSRKSAPVEPEAIADEQPGEAPEEGAVEAPAEEYDYAAESILPEKFVNLDRQKLTRKEREVIAAAWTGPKRGATLDAFFAASVDAGRQRFGAYNVYMGGETDALVVGIPTPALAFEYVIGQDVFPLGLVMQLVGKYGTCKSAMLAEFGRWFDMAGGGLNLVDNETKFNPQWYRSIMGREVFDRRVPFYRSTSLEDAQRQLTFAIKQTKLAMIGTKENRGPGRTIPILLGVDSIMGKQSEGVQEQIFGIVGKDGKPGTTGDGAASRGHPIEALILTRYMRTVPGMIDQWPFALVLINHLRINKDDGGNDVRHKGGGEMTNFQESYELEMSKIGGHKKLIQAKNYEGMNLRLSCEKNSFGSTHRWANCRLLWWDEPNPTTGEMEQKTVWDWDWTTVHLLKTLTEDAKSSPWIKENLKGIGFHLDCPESGDIQNLAWSRTLGMKAADAMPWSDLGAMIRENAPLMRELRTALRIVRRPRLQGNYQEQIGQLTKKSP